VTKRALATAYPEKATKRRRVREVLIEEKAWSDVVREAQESVELALKAMLREAGSDPPQWHDVGPILTEQAQLFPEGARATLPELTRISKWLRKEREFSYDGGIDFIPTPSNTSRKTPEAPPRTPSTCSSRPGS